MTLHAHRYLDIIERHIGHWNAVDADLDRPIKVDDFGLMELRFQRDVLVEILQELNGLTRRVDALRAQRDVLCRRIWARHAEFHGRTGAAPVAWTSSCISDFEATARMWSEQNSAMSEPKLLTDGSDLATFTQDVVALKDTFAELSLAEEAEILKKGDRDASFGSLRQKLAGYHQALESVYRPEHPFAVSAPLLEPVGSTAAPAPGLSAIWDMEKGGAYLEWTLSPDPMVKSYQVRRSTATPYDSSLEVVVDTVEAPTMHYATVDGVENPGGTAFYRVCGLTEKGGETPSNIVAVTRPESVSTYGRV
jgi:hypothetical protein